LQPPGEDRAEVKVVIAFNVHQFRALLMQPLQGVDQRDVISDHAVLADPELEDVTEQDQCIRFAALFAEKVQHHPVVMVAGFA